MAWMRRIEVSSGRGPYRVLVGSGLLAGLDRLLSEDGVPAPAVVATNTTVAPLVGRDLAERLGLPSPVELPDGEEHKRWSAVETLCARWLELGLHRRDAVVAVGGGVVTDTVGFAAAVYLRGVDWVALPTTLLAMVDAAVGGKTGVNLAQGKNLVGAFWPPRLVVADVDVLDTLPERELRAGAVEAAKAAWIGDRELLGILGAPPDKLDTEQRVELVSRAVAVKAEVVAADEREAGRRAVLNLGHTVGHALEAVTGYRRFLHGEAVAWGLRAVVLLARRRGLLSEDAARRLDTTLDRLGPYPPVEDLDPDRVLDHIRRDKKRDDLGVAWVLPTDGGVLLEQRASADEVREVLGLLRSAFRSPDPSSS